MRQRVFQSVLGIVNYSYIPVQLTVNRFLHTTSVVKNNPITSLICLSLASIGIYHYFNRSYIAKTQSVSNTILVNGLTQMKLDKFNTLLRDGERCLTDKNTLNEAEESFSEGLKIVYGDREIRKKTHGLQIICFERLAEVYLQRGDYIKATALYNFAWAVCTNGLLPSDGIESRIKSVEQQFLASIGNTAQASNIQLDLAHRKTLVDIRKDAKQRLEGGQDIQQIYKNIQDELIKKLANKVVEESHGTLGDPPDNCKWSLITFGSLARAEATPYSDFEFGILIEEGKNTERNKEYFISLTKLIFIKLLNLGETTPRIMNINALEWMPEEDSPTRKGFTFDGQMRGGCKTPLGNIHLEKDKTQQFELIHTPTAMAYLHDESNFKKDRHLSTVLNTVAFVYGDEELVRQYLDKVKLTLTNEQRQDRAINLLKESITKFSPKFGKKEEEGNIFNPKYHLYRLPNMVIDHLSLYCNTQANSIWERIDEIFGDSESPFYNPHDISSLKLTATNILRIRLAKYLDSNCRDDRLIKAIDVTDDRGKLELISDSLNITVDDLIKIYYVIVPLYRATKYFVDSGKIEYFRNAKLYCDNEHIKGVIFSHYIHDYNKAIYHLNIAKSQLVGEPILTQLEIMDELGVCYGLIVFNDAANLSKSDKAFNEALQISDKLPPTQISKYKSQILSNLGTLYLNVNLERALLYFDQAMNFCDNYEDKMQLKYNLGTCYLNQFYQHKNKLKQRTFITEQEALSSYNEFRPCVEHAKKEFHDNIEMLRKIVEPSIFIQDLFIGVFCNLGKAYFELFMLSRGVERSYLKSAIDYESLSYGIASKNYGDMSVEVLPSLLALAEIHICLSGYREARKFAEKALNIAKSNQNIIYAVVALNTLSLTYINFNQNADKAIELIKESYEKTKMLPYLEKKEAQEKTILKNIQILNEKVKVYDKTQVCDVLQDIRKSSSSQENKLMVDRLLQTIQLPERVK